MTMTHSEEVSNGRQKPDSTDEVAGVMTLHNKNLLSLNALLSRQGGLSVLCIKQCTESRHVHRKNQQAYAVTNSSEFKEVTWNKTAESTDSVKGARFWGKVWHTLYPIWFTLIRP